MIEKPHHGGRPPDDSFIDFSSNLHPEPPPESILQAASEGLAASIRYPDAQARLVRSTFSERCEIPAEQILPGPGSSTLLYQAVSVLKPKTVLIPTPCFSEYPHVSMGVGARVLEHPILNEDPGYPPSLPHQTCVILSNPCNPTGMVFPPDTLARWMHEIRKVDGWMILDEAYADFKEPGVDEPMRHVNEFPLIVLRSPLKFFSLPGLRAGLCFFPASMVDRMSAASPPWPLSAPALFAIHAALDLDAAVIHARRRRIRAWANSLRKALMTIPEISPVNSDVHYFLIRLPKTGPDGFVLRDQLAAEGIWIRTSAGILGLTGRDIRISTRFPEENGKLIGALKRIYRQAA